MKHDTVILFHGVWSLLRVHGWLALTVSRSYPRIWKIKSIETFPLSQLLENPLPYKGQILVVGGQVLSAKRLKNATQIEVLQLPLNRHMKPEESLQKSKGRFLALQEEFLDPATLPLGTRVTVVGEVSGMVTLPLDETTYDFPTLVIKSLTVWPPHLNLSSPSPLSIWLSLLGTLLGALRQAIFVVVMLWVFSGGKRVRKKSFPQVAYL